jgi:hypothetical protein
MKKLSLVILLSLLVGCATKAVPVTQKFPTAPDELTRPCSDLKDIPEDTEKLSVLASTVISNYSLYQDCKMQVDTWNEWYRTQKKIFEEVK